jgi:hypothetical protein
MDIHGRLLGVAMDCLKFHPGPPSLTLLRPVGVVHPQGCQLVVIFFVFAHPTPYAYGNMNINDDNRQIYIHCLLFPVIHRRTAWSVQRGRRRLLSSLPAGRLTLKPP